MAEDVEVDVGMGDRAGVDEASVGLAEGWPAVMPDGPSEGVVVAVKATGGWGRTVRCSEQAVSRTAKSGTAAARAAWRRFVMLLGRLREWIGSA